MQHLPKFIALAVLGGGLQAQVAFVRDHDRIHVTVNGRPFTTCYFEAENNKPYLHPLRSASGKVVTRRYPMEDIAGESTDHPHHRGVGFAHGDVNGFNFWASERSQADPKQGRILLDKVEKLMPGRQRGEIVASFRWLDPSGAVLLREHRTMTFYAHPTLRIVDFDIELRAQDRPVHFADTKEGSFYIRLGDALSEAGGGRMTNSSGLATEKDVWGKRAAWLDDSGVVEGERLGVVVFDHPDNPRHPPQLAQSRLWTDRREHFRLAGLPQRSVEGRRADGSGGPVVALALSDHGASGRRGGSGN